MADIKYCSKCGTQLEATASFCTQCGASTGSNDVQSFTAEKNRVTAGVLAILLGGIGVHKFYLNQIGLGIVYVLFCWTGIPSIIGLIEGILYLTMTDAAFVAKYVR